MDTAAPMVVGFLILSVLPARAAERHSLDALLDLLAARLALAPSIAAAKWNARASVEDLPRERQLLDALPADVAGRALDEGWVQEVVQAQIEASKAVQYAQHRVWRRVGQESFPEVRDLAADLRPALDRLTAQIVQQLEQVQAELVTATPDQVRAYRSLRHPLPAADGERAWRIAVAPLLGPGVAVRPDGGTRLDRVARMGLLRICTTGDYAPFSLWQPETEQFEGSDIALAHDLAATLGAEALFIRTSWARMVDDLVANRCDLGMGGVSVTLGRQQRAFFSAPYLVDGKTPIARCAEISRFQTIEQINQPSTRVVVNAGGTNEAFARERLARASIVVLPDNTRVFDEILAGRADVMVTDAIETRLQEKRRPGLCAIHPDEPFTYAEKAYLLPRGDTEFKAYVDQWLHLKIAGGDYARLQERWLR